MFKWLGFQLDARGSNTMGARAPHARTRTFAEARALLQGEIGCKGVQQNGSKGSTGKIMAVQRHAHYLEQELQGCLYNHSRQERQVETVGRNSMI